MENRKIKIEILEKYIGQQKELLDFIKNSKEVFERILAKIEIDTHIGYDTAEFYIDHNNYIEIFEVVMNEIYSADIDRNFQDHLFDLLNKLEPVSIDFKLTENEVDVKDVWLEGHEEWDFEITLKKPLDYIFENCERIAD